MMYLILRKHHDDYSNLDMTAGNEAHFLSKCPSEPATNESLSKLFKLKNSTSNKLKIDLLMGISKLDACLFTIFPNSPNCCRFYGFWPIAISRISNCHFCILTLQSKNSLMLSLRVCQIRCVKLT